MQKVLNKWKKNYVNPGAKSHEIKIQKLNLTPGATKNLYIPQKKLIKKAFLEQKLLNFKYCSYFLKAYKKIAGKFLGRSWEDIWTIFVVW